MKKSIFLTCLVLMIAGAAEAGKQNKKPAKADREPANAVSAKFSAFTAFGNLYVTVLGDGCNGMGGELDVAQSCRKDRMTRQGVVGCAVQVNVLQTARACDNPQPKPQVLESKLADTMIDPNAQYLILRYNDEMIRVGINR